MINLFEKAISCGELEKFAAGIEEYFTPDREYGDHSVLNSWISFVLPLIESKGPEFVYEEIDEMFYALLNSDMDVKTKNESLLYNLHVYYYLDSESRLKARKMKKINSLILDSLQQYILYLNSNNDSLGATISNALDLIKSRGGMQIDQD